MRLLQIVRKANIYFILGSIYLHSAGRSVLTIVFTKVYKTIRTSPSGHFECYPSTKPGNFARLRVFRRPRCARVIVVFATARAITRSKSCFRSQNKNQQYFGTHRAHDARCATAAGQVLLQNICKACMAQWQQFTRQPRKQADSIGNLADHLRQRRFRLRLPSQRTDYSQARIRPKCEIEKLTFLGSCVLKDHLRR
jgi:hypothetical protein